MLSCFLALMYSEGAQFDYKRYESCINNEAEIVVSLLW